MAVVNKPHNVFSWAPGFVSATPYRAGRGTSRRAYFFFAVAGCLGSQVTEVVKSESGKFWLYFVSVIKRWLMVSSSR